jgi:hypothetical protein
MRLGTAAASKATGFFHRSPQSGNAKGREEKADRARRVNAGETKIQGGSYESSEAIR